MLCVLRELCVTLKLEKSEANDGTNDNKNNRYSEIDNTNDKRF